MGQLNKEKYRNAILYFAHHARNVGRTKLWKLLYYLDFDHFEQFGASVTGDQYWKWENGPVPVAGLAIVRDMEAADDIQVLEEPTPFANPMYRVIPLREVNKSVFSQSEWDMLEAVARKWQFHSARDMSNATHGERPWLEADHNGLLDYTLASQRGTESDADDPGQIEAEGINMDVSPELALAQARSLAYAERIEHLWETDEEVREQIERGLRELQTGEYVDLNVDDVSNQVREGRSS